MKRLLTIVFSVLFGACALIDDDLSVCGEQLSIEYEMQLYTDLSVQLETELTSETDGPIRKALEQWLEPIFTDTAKDVDLRFYAAESDEIRHQIQKVINDNRTSYVFRLYKDNYMHLAVANIADNRQARIDGGEHSRTMMFTLPNKEDVEPLNTGLFTARLPMTVTDTTQRFEVRMYMVTSAVALIVDVEPCEDLVDFDGYILGEACGFSIRDSVFAYNRPTRMLFERIPIEEENPNPGPSRIGRREKAQSDYEYECYGTVGFPSSDEENSWKVVATTTLTNGRHTTTTLTIKDPLKAGMLRIFKCALTPDGELDPDPVYDKDLGLEVELDWKGGTGFDIDL